MTIRETLMRRMPVHPSRVRHGHPQCHHCRCKRAATHQADLRMTLLQVVLRARTRTARHRMPDPPWNTVRPASLSDTVQTTDIPNHPTLQHQPAPPAFQMDTSLSNTSPLLGHNRHHIFLQHSTRKQRSQAHQIRAFPHLTPMHRQDHPSDLLFMRP